MDCQDQCKFFQKPKKRGKKHFFKSSNFVYFDGKHLIALPGIRQQSIQIIH